GLALMISSVKYEDDFIIKKLEEARRFPDSIYGRQLPTWKSKPPKDLSDVFYLDSIKGTIIAKEDIGTDRVTYISDDIFDSSCPIWEIPKEYEKSFLQNPDKAKRDFASVPSGSV